MGWILISFILGMAIGITIMCMLFVSKDDRN